MRNKVFLWILGIIGFVVLLLWTAPYLFEDKLKALVKSSVNKNINAQVDFKDVDLSLFRSFPKASINIRELSIINKEPFLGDTLLWADKVYLKMSLPGLFKSNQVLDIQSIELDQAKINLQVDSLGVSNFDIALDTPQSSTEGKADSSDFLLNLSSYKITSLDLTYSDASSSMVVELKDFSHWGKGSFGSNVLDLDTHTKTFIGVNYNGINYLNNVSLELEAVFGADLNINKFTFKHNKALINQLPLSFQGFVQLLPLGQNYDLSFTTPNSDFKNFLALVPSSYSGNLDKVTTKGSFEVKGKIQGELNQERVPSFDISVKSEDAYFKYQDLSMAMEHIFLDLNLTNSTGDSNDTFLAINDLAFEVGKDKFKANAILSNMTRNPSLQATMHGIINLGNIKQVYPVDLKKDLSGVLSVNLNIDVDQKSIEQSKFENVKSSGNITLTDFKYNDASLQEQLQIQMAAFRFTTSYIALDSFVSLIGNTDIKAKGRVDNLYGFLFSKQVLKGDFNLSSNYFQVSDFVKESSSTTANTQERSGQQDVYSLEIPAFLDGVLQVDIKEVAYDKLRLYKLKGTAQISKETLLLKNMHANLLNGSIDFQGMVSTRDIPTSFNMDLKLNQLDIKQSFSEIDFLKTLAPISNVISGNISASIKMQGYLQGKTMQVDMSSLDADFNAVLSQTKIDPSASKMMTLVDQTLGFVNFKEVDLNQKPIHLTLDKGNVVFNPMDFKISGIPVVLSGKHALDQTMDYHLDFQVPPKVLGADIAGVLSKLSPSEQDALSSIPLRVDLTGNFNSPKISTDLKSALNELTNEIVQLQTKNLANKGKETLKDLWNDLNKQNKDSTASGVNTPQSDESVQKIQQGLKDIFSKKNKESTTKP